MAAPNLRLVGITLTLLVFVEGAADVMVVSVALDLLEIGQGSAWISATGGRGAVRGRGAGGTPRPGQPRCGARCRLPALSGRVSRFPASGPVVLAAYLWYFLMASATHSSRWRRGRCSSGSARMRRSLARTGFLETSRLAAMALGAIVAPVLVALFGIRGALLALGAVLPCSPIALAGAARLRYRCRCLERNFSLSSEDHPIFAFCPRHLEGVPPFVELMRDNRR